jgi:cytochrome c556
MQMRTALTSCALVLGAILSSGAIAAEGPAGAAPAAGPPPGMPSPAERAIEYRKAVYTVLGGNFGPIGGVLQGRAPYDAKEIAKRAERVAFMAGLAAEAFPEISKTGNTKAKPEIWTDKPGFDKAMKELGDSTAGLAALVKTDQTNSDAFKKAAGRVGQACKGCHDNYRAK